MSRFSTKRTVLPFLIVSVPFVLFGFPSTRSVIRSVCLSGTLKSSLQLPVQDTTSRFENAGRSAPPEALPEPEPDPDPDVPPPLPPDPLPLPPLEPPLPPPDPPPLEPPPAAPPDGFVDVAAVAAGPSTLTTAPFAASFAVLFTCGLTSRNQSSASAAIPTSTPSAQVGRDGSWTAVPAAETGASPSGSTTTVNGRLFEGPRRNRLRCLTCSFVKLAVPGGASIAGGLKWNLRVPSGSLAVIDPCTWRLPLLSNASSCLPLRAPCEVRGISSSEYSPNGWMSSAPSTTVEVSGRSTDTALSPTGRGPGVSDESRGGRNVSVTSAVVPGISDSRCGSTVAQAAASPSTSSAYSSTMLLSLRTVTAQEACAPGSTGSDSGREDSQTATERPTNGTSIHGCPQTEAADANVLLRRLRAGCVS